MSPKGHNFDDPMYRTCLFCNDDLRANDTIEQFPVGRRLAFDSARGRLWVVCTNCERWNLTPLETRWEAIDTCERLFQAERKRVTTDHIGLARLDEGLELVRIGKPLDEEFAAWRYGDQFGKRRRRNLAEGIAIAGAAGVALAGAITVGAAAGLGVLTYHLGQNVVRKKRSRRIIACVPTTDGETLTVLGNNIDETRIKSDFSAETRWQLLLPHEHGTITLTDDWALNALGLIMPTINGTGGSANRVHLAVKRLEAVHHASHFLRSAAALSNHDARPGTLGTIGKLPVDVRLAIEMAANEQNERHALEGEMWLLEFAWEQAEVIARIADDLLVPAEVERKLESLKEQQRKQR